MSAYFVGVDFGTAHTKACVRSADAERPVPVVMNAQASGLERFLLPSASKGWPFANAPKVIMASAWIEPNEEAERRAMEQAARVVRDAISAAVQQTDALFSGDDEKTFFVNVGVPWDVREPGRSEVGIAPEAKGRYELMLSEALSALGDARVQSTSERNPSTAQLEVWFPNERLAPLVVLYRARANFRNEGILLVDSGGWTTHMTILRWATVSGEDKYSQHGQCSTPHGVESAVGSLRKSLGEDQRLRTIRPVEVIESVMRSLYRLSSRNPGVLDPRPWPLRRDDLAEVAATVSRDLGTTVDEGRDLAAVALAELRTYFTHPRVEKAHAGVWAEAWALSPRAAWWSSYRLFLLGGASRIGRQMGDRSKDPLALVLDDVQRSGTTAAKSSTRDGRVAFTGTVYPETDRRFLDTFDIEMLERSGSTEGIDDALPYLFVAAGYTWPWSDWMPAIPVQGADGSTPAAQDPNFGSGILHK